MRFCLSKKSIDNLVAKTNILDLISKYLKVEKKGSSYFSKCPFHDDKNPSFSIDIRRNRYYCFGCNANGDAIQFLIEIKKISFKEAVSIIVNGNNFINFDKEKNVINSLFKSSDLFPLNKEVSLLYENEIKKHFFEEKEVFFFMKEREVNIDTIKKFNLGYSTKDWNYLSKRFKDKLSISKLNQLGLIVNKGNYSYDRFRDRVIFPIKNLLGDIVGFGGRSLYKDILPKYVNSSESVIFSKKLELYGLYEIKKECLNLDRLIIVEGYFDVITLNSFGINNVVATLGTAFTSDHFLLLKKFTKEIIFCFDGDSAGINAAWRAVKICLSFIDNIFNIRFSFLPDGYDPDLYIRKFNRNSFLSVIDASINIFDFMFSKLSNDLNLDIISDRLCFIKRVKDFASFINDNVIYKIIIDYFLEFLIYKRKKRNNIINKINNKKLIFAKLLAPAIKACIILIKNKNFVCNAKDILIYKSENDFEVNLFIDLVYFIINNPNSNIPDMFYKKLNLENNSFYDIIKSISEIDLEKEFIEIVSRMINNFSKNKEIFNLISKSKSNVLSEEEKILLNKLVIEREKF